MTQPSVKKNPDGTWTITGVQERKVTQTRADYEDMVKASQLVTGEQGETARKLITQNPMLSGGVLASLSSYGAVPDNELVKTLTAIDAQTRAQRELDTFQEAQRIANEKFDRSGRGTFWRYLKGLSRGAVLIGESITEPIYGVARIMRSNFDKAMRGEEQQNVLSPDFFKNVFAQTKITQAGKQLIEEGRIDLGRGFFPSEETGAGFAARRAKLDTYGVNVKVGNRTYQRPWSIFDPVVTVITSGNADTGIGSFMTAFGDLLFAIKTDAFVVAGGMKARAKELERVARTSQGMKAAKAYQEKALLDAQLEELAKKTKQSKDELDAAIGPERAAKKEEFLKALDEQMRVADEYDNIIYDPEKIASFLSGPMAAPAIDALAEITDWKQIWRLGKERGGRGGFNVEQSKALAAAGNREEVLNAIAPYVAKGEVVADVLTSGTAAGRAIKQVINSKIVPGKVAQVVDSVKGLGARGLRKLPWYNQVVKAYSTVAPRGQAIHSADKDALIDAIYSYGRIANVAESKLNELADIVALTDDASEAGFTASAKLFDEIYKANIKIKGVDPELLEQVTRVFQNGTAKMGSYWAARHADGAKLDYVFSNGKTYTITGPHLDSEYLNSVVYFPDARELLDTISILNKIPFAGKTTEKIKEELDILTNIVWKRIVLVRPAYILRNIAEEQIRVLGTGHISFFNHPVMAMGMWLGKVDGPAWRTLLAKFDPFRNTIADKNFKIAAAEEELLAEVAAHDVANSYVSYMANRSVSGFDNDVRTAMVFSGFGRVGSGHPRWWEGLANEIRILHNSIAGRAVARTGPTAENQKATVDFLLRGAGKQEWNQFAKVQKPEIRDWLLSDDGAMAYLFTGVNAKGDAVSLLARIEEAAGRGGEASQTIKNLIAFGKIQAPGFDIAVPTGVRSAENSIKNAAEVSKGKKALKDANQEFADVLRNSFEGKGNWDGIDMNVAMTRYRKDRDRKRLGDTISDWFFDISVSLEKSTTMGPEWRQSYWDAIYDISGALDANAVAGLEKVARKSLTPLQSWTGAPIGREHAVWKAFKNAEAELTKASKGAITKAQKFTKMHPNLKEYKDGGMGGLPETRSVVGFVSTKYLAKMPGNVVDEAGIDLYRQKLRSGEGYENPIIVFYDNETGLAYVAEGNHRLQAAIRENVDYVPVRVARAQVKAEKTLDAQGIALSADTPGRKVMEVKHGKKLPFTTGGRNGPVEYMPTDVHPSFIFDKEYVLTEGVEQAKKFGNITLDEAHEYASMVATKKTADLFYDASRKRLLFHQMRIIAPFAAAWEDTIRRWSEIALDNPLQVYKIQKSLQWLTKPESSALYSLTDVKDYYDPNQGFFFTDPMDGERKLYLPFLGTGLNFLSNLAGGQGVSTAGPYAFAATPQSLNFAFGTGSLMPGVGPGIQFGLKVLDNLGVNPINIAPIGMRDTINKIIYPFGEPDLTQGVQEGLFPGNWRRIWAAAAGNEEAYAAAFAPVMNYLASGGNYDLNSMEDQARLVRDTNKFSMWFTLFRGIFGMVSAFPLQPNKLSTLDDGNTVLSTALYDDFKQLEVASGGNYNKAYADFMDLYGPEAIFAIINTSSGAPTNLATYELIQREPEVVDIYADTYGYAYPNGGFSTELYKWQRRAGEKEKFTAQQLIERATSLRYYAASDRLMTRLVSGDFTEEEYEEASKALRETYIAAGLKQESDPYKNARVKEQLRRMAEDTRFADSDAVDGLRDYLYLRDQALAAAGITSDNLASKGALPQRQWLAQQAKDILSRNPEFYKFYYRFFKEELEG